MTRPKYIFENDIVLNNISNRYTINSLSSNIAKASVIIINIYFIT